MTQRRIAVLPDHLANKIAAGEVIQRPESVVKELIENSLDAGATSVVVVIKEGGKNLIQVADDGSGMDEQDAATSFLRHSTSKISSYEDLEEIRTFGFRGEALASIAAVAQVTMKTRRADDEAGVVVHIDGGAEPRMTREARERGTTVTLQNLFYNVPARRKFLKSDNTEFRHVHDAVHRVAISHPEIALQFVSDGDTIFHLRPSTLQERLAEVFGDRQFHALIPIEEQTEFLRVSGYIGKPGFGQKTRTHQYLFLNGRYIVNRNISHAVYSAYEHLLIKGAFPFFLLFLEIDPRRVDVNVHPSKMEAKFEDEHAMYRVIASVVRKALGAAGAIPALTMEGRGTDAGSVGLSFTGSQHDWPSAGGDRGAWTFPERVDRSTGEIFGAPPGGAGIAGRLLGGLEERFSPAVPEVPAPLGETGSGSFGIVLQLHNKYILAQIPDGLLIVDQHVAHERVLYEMIQDRLAANMRTSQQLLFPQTIQLPPGDYALVEELLPHFDQLGFAIKLFGKNTIVVDGMPPDVRQGQEGRIVEDVLGMYKEYQEQAGFDARDRLAKSLSCKAAVKAGDPLKVEEMRTLIERLLAARLPYVCPHGRPILLRLSIEELDRRFGRA